ncbi:hypothetical protein D9615_004425 [Tricholomella constricta]|uniref:Nicotinamide-nucleotide adenylyltransferase n=1 Tax=Tricholomella constricta TaxID=117010 RepID=A0A8H5HEY4_9AGAR|nr:hypothetical protein D9615_004425 [Tricholomella constricta]
MSTAAEDEMAATRASAAALLNRLQHGLSKPPVELVHVPHNRWPLPKSPPTRRSLKLLVLDASFNPPTLAHLALANSLSPFSNNIGAGDDSTPDYDAKLLLLSVRNADKALKPGDATYLQRLDMVEIFTRDIMHQHANSDAEETSNVAIAIIDEPTFVGKSTILQTFFKARSAATSEYPSYDTQLNFILGYDTLERLIQPRYYGSPERMLASLRKFLSPAPEGDNARIICARRASSSFPHSVLGSTDLAVAQEFISSERIAFIDIGEDVKGYSSSEVRNTIHRMGLDAKEWRMVVPSGIAEYIVRERLYVDMA